MPSFNDSVRQISLSKLRVILTSAFVQLFLVIFYAAVYVFFHPPLFQTWRNAFIGGVREDPGLYVWLIKYSSRFVISSNSLGYDIGIFYPFGRALAFSDNFLLPALVAKLFFAAGVSLLETYNIILIVAAAMNGYCCAVLAFYVCGNLFFAGFSGLVFMNLPFFVSQLGHPQLHFAFVLPLGLWATLKALEQRSFFHASLFGFTLLIAFTTSVYYALFLIVLTAIAVISWLALKASKNCIVDLFYFALANVLWLVPFYYLASPYTQVRQLFGARDLFWAKTFAISIYAYFAAPGSNWLWGGVTTVWSNYEGYLYFSIAVTLLVLVAFFFLFRIDSASSQQPLARLSRGFLFTQVLAVALLFFFQSADVKEAGSFTSMVVSSICELVWLGASFGFAICLGVMRYRKMKASPSSILSTRHSKAAATQWKLYVASNYPTEGRQDIAESTLLSFREKTALLWFCAIFFLVLSFGTIFNQSSLLHMLNPYSWLYYYAPGFDALRVPARLGVVVVMLFCVLASVGLRHVNEYISSRLFKSRSIFAEFSLTLFFIIGAGIEFYSSWYPLVPEINQPRIFSEIKASTPYDAALCIPFGALQDSGARYAYLQTSCMHNISDSGIKLVNGYSGVITNFHVQLRDKTADFPSEQSMEILSKVVGLRYVVYLGDLVDPSTKDKFYRTVGKFKDSLTLLKRDSAGNALFQFHPLSSGPKVELYAAPHKNGERLLSFDMRRVKAQISDGASDEHLIVKVQLGSRRDSKTGEILVVTKDIELPKPSSADAYEWKTYSLRLPPSRKAVQPHGIRFNLLGHKNAVGFELKDAELRDVGTAAGDESL